MMRLSFVYLEDDEVGEVEGMFDSDGTLLGTWCNNDATWRNEYFEGFMKKLGFEVVSSSDKKFKKKLKDRWLDVIG